MTDRPTESVWDYPRPPSAERTSRRVRAVLAGHVMADTTRAVRVCETSHPPVYYLPPEDVAMEHLETALKLWRQHVEEKAEGLSKSWRVWVLCVLQLPNSL